MEMSNCGNCGSPLFDNYNCSYCKSRIDPILNKINDNTFRHYSIAYSSAYIPMSYAMTYVVGQMHPNYGMVTSRDLNSSYGTRPFIKELK